MKAKHVKCSNPISPLVYKSLLLLKIKGNFNKCLISEQFNIVIWNRLALFSIYTAKKHAIISKIENSLFILVGSTSLTELHNY